MKRFTFGLAKILEYRRKQEERCKQELQRADLLRRQSEARLAELVGCEQRERESLKKLQEHEMDLREVLLHQRRVQFLATGARKQANDTERLKQQESTVRERALSASRQTRVLENIEYRKRAEYRDAALNCEQKEMDDIAVHVWRRASSDGEKR